jgi:GMP synthase (glutamine-hydrolysing)
VTGGHTRIALAIRHEAIAHLGNLEPVLRAHGYDIRYLDAGTDDFDVPDADLVIVLGGDMGVNDTDAYPHLHDEVAFLRDRLASAQPTLGVCLGAQLMAVALGSRVYQGPTMEIGFRSVEPTDAGADSPVRHFANVPVVQWHRDTFELPADATRLAGSASYANEAYSVGTFALAVQFHPELTGGMYEEWIADGEGDPNLDAGAMRAQRDAHAPAAEAASAAMLDEWLTSLAP